MRIIAGTARGRRIRAPEGTITRPTSDRVREAIFNSLVSLDVVASARVLDLFAGTGAMGLEALSRGAAQVIFVERDRRASDVIRHNVNTLGFRAQSRIITGDVWGHMASLGPADLAFCDPPYGFDEWPRLLQSVPATLIVAEAEGEIDVSQVGELLRHKRYGSTFVSIVSPMPPALSE